MSRSELLYFNGLAPDGTYLSAPMSLEDFGQCALEAGSGWKLPPEPDPRDLHDPTRAPRYGVDPKDLAEAGWGVVFPLGTPGRVRRALQPLLELRRDQAGQGRFTQLEYLPGQGAEGFLRAHGVPPGPANPDKVPYYLLLVGGPDSIPFRFQSELDQQYAVGRLHFDEPIQYRWYAQGVERAVRRPRRRRHVTFFGVKNSRDPATEQTLRGLARPLADKVEWNHPRWTVERFFGEEARTHRLIDLLGGEGAPSVVFATCHGLGVRCDDPRQVPLQGGLICSDWPGMKTDVLEEHVVTAEDIGDEADLGGQIAFFFACYSGGTPRLDSFPMVSTDSGPKRLAPKPFTSALCRRLLGHPGGSALAVVGHVDRTWTTSFDWLETTKTSRGVGQPEVFESMLHGLLDGLPVGAAMEYFGQLHGDLATKLTSQYDRTQQGLRGASTRRFARLWLGHNDARNFMVFGDPAVTVAARGVV